ncbi:MAG: nitroreductase family protein [Deltaproteobacteria bacterium]|nr:nitroreductase family protein [Deltaproteobacteria bacterium]MBN2672880.1 nitroreductase family protein [Deltaproteobacteria bacterium]
MLDLTRNRRSTRKFTDRNVPGELVALLQEAALRSPTSKNNRPWEFIFVDDSELLNRLSECKPHGASFLKHAPLAVVIAADASKSDVWVEDCAIAAITLQYAAQSFDLGSCWVQVRKRQHESGEPAEDAVKKILGLPQSLRVASIIGIGYRAEHRSPVPAEKLETHKIHFNRYQ